MEYLINPDDHGPCPEQRGIVSVATWATGTKYLEPVRYLILGGKRHRRWWNFWAPREEWWIESDLVKLGPFPSYGIATGIARRLGAKW